MVADVGKDDFKELSILDIEANELTDKACDTLVAVLNKGGMPNLIRLRVHAQNDFSDAAADALAQAAARRGVAIGDEAAIEDDPAIGI